MAEEEEGKLSDVARSWLAKRTQPGNWFRIAPLDEIPAEIVGWERTLLHMFQIAFTPEIQRRLDTKVLGEDFVLWAVQLIQPEEGGRIVRLNDEVRGIPVVKVGRPVEKGERIFASDMRNLVSFDLEESELDCGHFTIFWHGAGWNGTFDFRSGRAKSAQMIQAAREFLAASRFSAANGHDRPSIDNLFSACELLSKAQLILHRSPAAKAKTHGAVGSAINNWGKLGNVDAEFLKLYNRIAQMRAPARYDASASITSPTSDEFEIVGRELELLSRRVAQRIASGKDGET